MIAKKYPLGLLMSIVFISAGVLGYGIVLMRLLTIIQWNPFPLLIISVALLGFAISAVILARYREIFVNRFKFWFCLFSMFFSVTSIVCWLAAQYIPFNPLALWNVKQIFFMSVMSLLLLIPFLLASLCLGVSLCYRKDIIASIYAMHLLGAGCGALLVISLLSFLTPQHLLIIAASFAIFAIIFQFSGRIAKWVLGLSCLALVILTIVSCNFAEKYFPLKISPYKAYPLAMQVHGSKTEANVYNAYGMMSIVTNDSTPFQYAPGLSSQYHKKLPKQIAVFQNGNAETMINQVKGEADKVEYVKYLTSALAYALTSNPSVAVIGAGGGFPVWQAKLYHATNIDVIESNPRLTQLLTISRLDDILYADRKIFVYPINAREYFNGIDKQYDVIQLSRIATDAILSSIEANYTLTNESLMQYFDHLTPEGILSITFTLNDKPTSLLKLINMLRNSSHFKKQMLAQHLLIIRSGKTITCILKKSALTHQDIKLAKQFSHEKNFDFVYYPGIIVNDVNKYNILPHADYYLGVSALLGNHADDFTKNYVFDISSVSDELPYFSNTFRWSALSQYSERPQGGIVFPQWRYVIIFLTLVIVSILSLFFVFTPIYFWGKQHKTPTIIWRVCVYFSCVAVAFMFILVSTIQKLSLILHDPVNTYCMSVVSILIFAACGSLVTQHIYETMQLRNLERLMMITVTALLVTFILAFTYVLPQFAANNFGLSNINNTLQIILCMAPVAFMIGMPFPLGLSWITKHNQDLIPWVWGINGAASVFGVVLAILLLFYLPVSSMNLLAIALYSSVSTLLIKAA